MSHNSTVKLDQKEYLKKYLSGDKSKKKKKKDKKYDRDGKVRIIDDDAIAYRAGASDDDLLLTGEDAPQIVGEYVETEPNRNGGSKWRSIAGEKEEVQMKREKSPQSRWGKQIEQHRRIKDEFSPKREHRNKSSDTSPPRKREKHINPFKDKSPDLSPKRPRANRNRSPDLSPARSNPFKKTARGRSSSTDVSPTRNKNRKISPQGRHRASSVDLSPPRVNPFRQDINEIKQLGSPTLPPPRGTHKLSRSPRRNQTSTTRIRRTSADLSPPRRRVDSRSPRRRDQSPPRRGVQHPFYTGSRRSADLSPARHNRRSPPSREGQRAGPERRNFERPDNRRQNGSNNDRYRSISSGSSSQRRREDSRQRYDSRSLERPQTSTYTARDQERNRFGNNQSRRSPDKYQNKRSPPRGRDTDQSPPRRRLQSPPQKSESPRIKRERRSSSHERAKMRWEMAAAAKARDSRCSRSDSPPPTHKAKASKTLDGKKAGLQDAQALKEETAARRRAEDRMFEKMSNELSGRDAEVAVRSTGRRAQRDRDAKPEDAEKVRRKEEREKQKKEQYDRWGKGLKQVEEHRARLEEHAYESCKPLARYSNDTDLEKHLREQERVDDPMLAYMRRKKKDTLQDSSVPQKPVYEGSYPENRFGIRPGYRWDGVDRSNGYEKKYFDVQNAKRAGQEEAYKYSVEDM